MSESREPPRLPDVVDEAGPSPSWLPWLGVGLLCVFGAAIAALQVIGGDEDGQAPASELAAEAGEQGAAGAQPEAKP